MSRRALAIMTPRKCRSIEVKRIALCSFLPQRIHHLAERIMLPRGVEAAKMVTRRKRSAWSSVDLDHTARLPFGIIAVAGSYSRLAEIRG